ncbi:hypothetical protein EYF80_009787 [Liparis tanakae]|uniref:Uncharacterized protein n=1 Tax=Liparis tanakae TaxID=230148 RepID=A0A4Z2IPM4_9TELE|nr:hypothetical protein EYF80_009787 [Liparis tanakae]
MWKLCAGEETCSPGQEEGNTPVLVTTSSIMCLLPCGRSVLLGRSTGSCVQASEEGRSGAAALNSWLSSNKCFNGEGTTARRQANGQRGRRRVDAAGRRRWISSTNTRRREPELTRVFRVESSRDARSGAVVGEGSLELDPLADGQEHVAFGLVSCLLACSFLPHVGVQVLLGGRGYRGRIGCSLTAPGHHGQRARILPSAICRRI